jgi:hypothetical protein
MAPLAVCPDYIVDFTAHSRSTADIFANLRFLSGVLELKQPFSIAQVDSMWYSDKVYLVQRDLVYSSLEPGAADLDIACYIAASIYVDAYMRDLGFQSRIVAVMVSRLKSLLELKILPSSNHHDEYAKTILFWILVVGAIAAKNKTEQQWFLDNFRNLYEKTGVRHRSDMEEALRKILWSRDWTSELERIFKTLEGYGAAD